MSRQIGVVYMIPAPTLASGRQSRIGQRPTQPGNEGGASGREAAGPQPQIVREKRSMPQARQVSADIQNASALGYK